jgi:perosamine synthetase
MTLLSAPNISGNEWKYVKDCLDTAWVSSVGSYVDRFEAMMAHFTGTKYAVATSNGTSALHIALMLADVELNDYVMVPDLTFVASLNSICYTGARPILVDVSKSSWQMDLDLLENFLANECLVQNGKCIYKNGRTIKAIMPVHVLGSMGNMEHLKRIANKYYLTIIEDATEALGSYYKGKHSGSFGLAGCFSFNGNKIITTGGGGMIVTNNEVLAKKAKHLTTQAKSDPFEYYHDDVGYNYRLVNVLAAIGVAQMEQLPSFIKLKKEINQYYKEHLRSVGDITFQQTVEGADDNCWLFTLRSKKQKQLLKALNDKGLQSRPLWVPMNRLPMFCNDIYVTNNDNAGSLYSECLSIPCSTYITIKEMDDVIAVIKDCFKFS